MAAYSELQEREFTAAEEGFTAVRHQREVGTGYFDAVAMAISGGKSATVAMAGSTEADQFSAGSTEVEQFSQGRKVTADAA
jgi:isocitrate lyase